VWVCGEGGWERREEQEGGVRSEGRNSDKERRGVLVAREARIREVGAGELLQLLCVHCSCGLLSLKSIVQRVEGELLRA
jgi:hypothetical protein